MKQDLELYYIAPSNKIFEDLRKSAIKIWKTYDNKFGYVDEKAGKVRSLQNFRDNFMYIFAMFDPINQQKVEKFVAEQVNSTPDQEEDQCRSNRNNSLLHFLTPPALVFLIFLFTAYFISGYYR